MTVASVGRDLGCLTGRNHGGRRLSRHGAKAGPGRTLPSVATRSYVVHIARIGTRSTTHKKAPLVQMGGCLRVQDQ